MALIDGADFIVTSSFHGTSFSHIYHKQFAVVLPKGNTMRIRDILNTAGTENRIIKSLDDISIVDQKINYDDVQKRIDSVRQQSYDFLNHSFAQFE